MTPPSLPDDSDPPDTPLSTLHLAQAIMLMTHELRLHKTSANLTPKMKAPDTFDGSNLHKLNNFILLCNLYFQHNSAFSHDEAKITFALSHLCGTALELFEPTILDSSKNTNWLHDWSAFVCTLCTHLGLIDPIADAEDNNDNLKMSESHHIVKYNVKFNHLAVQKGWNSSVLRHQYYSGLAEHIKDIMGQQGKPSTLSTMKNLAHSIDSRYWERLHEKSHSENPALHSATESDYFDPPLPSKPNSTPSKISNKSQPQKPLITSDKLDKNGKLTIQERQRCFDNNLCLFCGRTGHMVKECPKSLAKAHATQALENPDSGNSDSEDSDSISENSTPENSTSKNSALDKSTSRNSDSEDPNSENSDSENSDLEDSDSRNSHLEDSNNENSNSDNPDSDSADSEHQNSGSDSESRNSDSDNSESDDSDSDSE